MRRVLLMGTTSVLLFAVASPALGLEAKGRIRKDRVVVQGKDAVPGKDVSWQGVAVTQADEQGAFRFETLIPPQTDCVGYVEDDALNEVEVLLRNCRMHVRGFYFAAQGRATVSPGQTGSVRSTCDLGDLAVSGAQVVFADDFRIGISGPVISSATGQHSWTLSGANKGTDDADIRISASCADVALR